MENIFRYFVIFFIGITFAQAQNNLIFNRVINYANENQDGLSSTVPEGKVWKIESYERNLNDTGVLVNGVRIHSLPFWVSSGQNVSWNGTTSTGNSTPKLLSIIEFNLVSLSSGGDISGDGMTSIYGNGLNFEEIIEISTPSVDLSSIQQSGNFKRVAEISVPSGKVWRIIGMIRGSNFSDNSDGSINFSQTSNRIRIGDFPFPDGHYQEEYGNHIPLYSEGTYGIFIEGGGTFSEKIKVIQYSIN